MVVACKYRIGHNFQPNSTKMSRNCTLISRLTGKIWCIFNNFPTCVTWCTTAQLWSPMSFSSFCRTFDHWWEGMQLVKAPFVVTGGTMRWAFQCYQKLSESKRSYWRNLSQLYFVSLDRVNVRTILQATLRLHSRSAWYVCVTAKSYIASSVIREIQHHEYDDNTLASRDEIFGENQAKKWCDSTKPSVLGR